MPAIYPNVATMGFLELFRTELVNCEVNLYQNDYTPVPGTVLGDLDIATFSGYAAKVVAALLAAYLDPVSGASAQIATQQWDHSGGATANTIYGFWVETTGGDLRLVGRFDSPIGMAALGDSIPLDVKFNLGN